MDTFTLLRATCGSTTILKKRVVAFPQQQWLGERVTILRSLRLARCCIMCDKLSLKVNLLHCSCVSITLPSRSSYRLFFLSL